MSDKYTPGDGARTLRWVPGMVDKCEGERCLSVDEHGDGAVELSCYEYGKSVYWPDEITPDLTDRATFLLALDQLSARVNATHVIIEDRGWSVERMDGDSYGGDEAEALDRALWETRERTETVTGSRSQSAPDAG